MAGQSLDWKTWALGASFTLLMSIGGVVCNNFSVRVAKVEAAQEGATVDTRMTAVQIAILQESVKALSASLDKLDAGQNRLIMKMDVLTDNMIRDSKRWNAEMDRLAKSQEAERKK